MLGSGTTTNFPSNSRSPCSIRARTYSKSNGFLSSMPWVRIDKSVLAIGVPRRYRDREHLRLVAKQACLICARKPPSDPHHLRYMQPRALGRKVSDEFAVPLCRSHHRELHRSGNEPEWWKARGIDPTKVATTLWKRTRKEGRKKLQQPKVQKIPILDGGKKIQSLLARQEADREPKFELAAPSIAVRAAPITSLGVQALHRGPVAQG